MFEQRDEIISHDMQVNNLPVLIMVLMWNHITYNGLRLTCCCKKWSVRKTYQGDRTLIRVASDKLLLCTDLHLTKWDFMSCLLIVLQYPFWGTYHHYHYWKNGVTFYALKESNLIHLYISQVSVITVCMHTLYTKYSTKYRSVIM